MPKIEADGHRSFTIAELESIKDRGMCKGCAAEPKRSTSSYGEECAKRHREETQGLPVLGVVSDRTDGIPVDGSVTRGALSTSDV